MPETKKRFSLTQIITTAGACVALVAGIFAIDARYTKDADLESVKNEIIRELRTEVTKNRSVMIDTMQREADDLEFQMFQLEEQGKTPPRYMVDKHKQITRDIQELKNETDSD